MMSVDKRIHQAHLIMEAALIAVRNLGIEACVQDLSESYSNQIAVKIENLAFKEIYQPPAPVPVIDILPPAGGDTGGGG